MLAFDLVLCNLRELHLRKQLDFLRMKKTICDFPKLCLEFHPTKNGDADPRDISFGSKKKVWWRCLKNPKHDYPAPVGDRTRKHRPSGCPFCAGKKVLPEDSLARRFPEIALEWHPRLNSAGPETFAPFSHKKVWWTCPESKLHDYDAIIADRTGKKKVGCPYCTGVRVALDTSLEYKFPNIAVEWHPKKNGALKPSEITARSNKVVWWVCEKGHSYQMSPDTRIGHDRGCNQCSKFGSSQETRIYCELKRCFPDTKFRQQIYGVEIDILIPSLKIGIEYDGAFYHQDRQSNDLKKNSVVGNEGLTLIRVREKPLTKVTDLDVISRQRAISKADMNDLISSICKVAPETAPIAVSYLSQRQFANEDDYKRYLSYFPSPFPENSLAETHPDIAAQWDTEKNGVLSPYNFTHGSKYRAFWLCQNGHSHRATINTKVTHFGSGTKGCKYCSGRARVLKNSLLATHPDVAKDWDVSRNGSLTPRDLGKGSEKLVWWKCHKHPDQCWEQRVKLRVRNWEALRREGRRRRSFSRGRSCPICVSAQ